MANLPDRQKISWRDISIEKTSFGSFFNIHFRKGATIIDMNYDSSFIAEYVQIQDANSSESCDIFITPKKSLFIAMKNKAEDIILTSIREAYNEMFKTFNFLREESC